MTHRISPEQFQENLDHFQDTHADWERYNNTAGAYGRCYDASCDYDAGGPEGHQHEGEHTSVHQFSGFTGDSSRADLRHGPYSDEQPNWTHYAAVTETTEGPMAVDWTYRQFDASADFPHVEHLDEYRKRWSTGPDPAYNPMTGSNNPTKNLRQY